MSKFRKKFLSHLPGTGTGIIVVDNDLSYAIRLFKRTVKDSGKLNDYYQRTQFVKPSVERREIVKNAKFRQQKESKCNH